MDRDGRIRLGVGKEEVSHDAVRASRPVVSASKEGAGDDTEIVLALRLLLFLLLARLG